MIIIGFFDNLRKKKEAKRLGLNLDSYEQYLSAQSTGISVEEFKRYHAAFSSQYSLEQFLQYLHLEKKQFSPQQIRRFLTELDGKLEIADYGAFLEAEKTVLDFPQFLTYHTTLSHKMSIPEYIRFQTVQEEGVTLEHYLRYLEQYKEDMTLDQYTQFLKSESFGLCEEPYPQDIASVQQEEEQNRYQDFLTARSLGITLDEFYLSIEAAKQDKSMEIPQKYPEDEAVTDTCSVPVDISSEIVPSVKEEPRTVVSSGQTDDVPNGFEVVSDERKQAENEERNKDVPRSQAVNNTVSISSREELIAERITDAFNSRIVSWADTLTIELPNAFLISTDAAVIGPHRALVAVANDEMSKVDSPYTANQSMTILFGPDISEIAEADAISDRLGLVNPKICIDTPELNVRYALRERDKSLFIFAGLISTVRKTYPFQIFFREQSKGENTALVERILKSISISDQPSCTLKRAAATQMIPKEKYIRVWKEETDKTTKNSIPCPPGQEPTHLKQKVERFLAKLEVAYPEKTVTYLHRDHKKLGERLTYLYRELGYPDGNSMLRAYGYTPVNPSGRPAKNHTDVIDELKCRYSTGPKCATITQLKRDNPDLAPRIHTLHNQTHKLFGKDFAEYLREQNILIS